MPTLTEALRGATRDLAAVGIADPQVDARILLCAAAGIDHVALIRDPDSSLTAKAATQLDTLLRRRGAREPVSRILGRRDFWGLTLCVTPDVLDPRPETETLVGAVLDGLGANAKQSNALRVVDLGTGSGAILCAFLKELPAAMGWAVDRSVAACAVARRNLVACGLGPRSLVLQGDWASALAPQSFDIVMSNPPYIQTDAIADLDPDVRDHDPRAALDGGPDGLAAYRAIAADLPRILAPDGLVAFEVGRGQAGAVAALMADLGLAAIATRRDLAGIERVVSGRL